MALYQAEVLFLPNPAQPHNFTPKFQGITQLEVDNPDPKALSTKLYIMADMNPAHDSQHNFSGKFSLLKCSKASTPTGSVWHGSHKQSCFPPSMPFKVLKQPSLTILAPEKTCAEGEEQNHLVPCTNQDQALMVNFKQLYFLPKCC